MKSWDRDREREVVMLDPGGLRPGEWGGRPPLVSIGMPVFNGEEFLRTAIESVLQQDFESFELVISDNASTDATARICGEFAADPRVRYFRTSRNRGAAWNFNTCFQHARGEYFKWAAADDVVLPGHLTACMEVLLRRPEVVACDTGAADIDAAGRVVHVWDDQPKLDLESPVARLARLLPRRHQCFPVFGLVRTHVLAATNLIGPFPDSDDVLVAELALRGRIAHVDEVLFHRRHHGQRSMAALTNARDRVGWFDPEAVGQITMPAWHLLTQYVSSIREAPLTSSERVQCYLALRDWGRRHRRSLVRNVGWAMKHRLLNSSAPLAATRAEGP